MKKEEFQAYFEQHAPIYDAWGHRLVSEIDNALRSRLGERYSSFLKIPPEPRVKKIGSAVGKIVLKNYNNPIEQMTDIVGVRFVVLFRSDIDIISQVIEGSSQWIASLDRDYDEEIYAEPSHFDYQSKHYILRANGDIPCGDFIIPNQMACEVQLRTILQHAYAEIVHDNIYKPSGVVTSKSKRLVARSMALMETTDDLFSETIKELEQANHFRNETYVSLLHEYKELVDAQEVEIDVDFNYSIIDIFRDKIENFSRTAMSKFLVSRPFIKTSIENKYHGNFLFRQPSVLLIYYLATRWNCEIKRSWPYGSLQNELDTIFSDLGIAHDDFIS